MPSGLNFAIMRIFTLSFLILVLIVSTLFAQTPDEQAREYYKRGNMYYQMGMFKQAQEEYNKAINLLKQHEASAPKQPVVPSRSPKVGQETAQPQPPQTLPQQQPQQPAGITEYVIGDEDALRISVWQNPDLDQEAIVRPDGKISVPLIGDVPARGLTITQLDEDMTRRLSEYVRAPEISISLSKIGGSKVILLGEIGKPGIYAMTGQKTLLEAIGMAGGFTRDAVPSSIVLIRGGLLHPKAERINLSKALKGKDFIRQNIVLQAEDVVFIPKKFIANLNYFLMQITGPLSQGSYIAREYDGW
jgi:polysaccharide export outer membrane protein